LDKSSDMVEVQTADKEDGFGHKRILVLVC